MTAEPLRVFDLFDPGKPDPVLEAEVAAQHAAYPDPRSHEARKAWRDAHPDQKAPVRRTGRGALADLRDALDPETERTARKGSRQPSMHPAVSGGGEVTRICPDSWHDGDPVTEHARQCAAEMLARSGDEEG